MTNPYAGSFNGFEFGTGARPGASVRSLANFGDTKGSAVVTEASGGRPAHVGPVTLPSKQPRIGFNLHADTPAQLRALRDQIDLAFDPAVGVLPLTIDGRAMFVRVLEIDPTIDPSWPGPERTTECDILCQAGDALTYSTPTVVVGAGDPASSFDLSFSHVGTRSTRSGNAWTVAITAHGAVTSPYIQRVDTGQIVTWQGLAMTDGQVLTVDTDRVSRVGTLRADQYRRSADGSMFPDWPVLTPGSQTINVGCATGLISVSFSGRSSWA